MHEVHGSAGPSCEIKLQTRHAPGGGLETPGRPDSYILGRFIINLELCYSVMHLKTMTIVYRAEHKGSRGKGVNVNINSW